MSFFLSLVFLFSQQASAKQQEKVFPLQSPEEIKFIDRKENSFYGFLKTDDFVGFVERKKEVNPDLQTLDFYQFTNEKKSFFDQKKCEEILARMFGPLKEITLKINVTQLGKQKNGPIICEAKAIDPDTHATIPERLIFVSSQKNFHYAFVARLSKKSDQEILKNLQNFVQNLK